MQGTRSHGAGTEGAGSSPGQSQGRPWGRGELRAGLHPGAFCCTTMVRRSSSRSLPALTHPSPGPAVAPRPLPAPWARRRAGRAARHRHPRRCRSQSHGTPGSQRRGFPPSPSQAHKKPPKNQAVTPPCTFSSLYLQLWQHRPDQLVSTGKVPAPSWGPKSVPGAAPTAPLRARVGRGRSLSPEGPGTVQGTVQGTALRGCWRNGEALQGRSGALPKAKAAGTGTSSITAGQRQLWHGAGKARIPEQRQRLRGSKGHEDAGRPPGPPPPGSLHSSPESTSCGFGGGHPAALSLPP